MDKNEKLIRYSMQLAYLHTLLSAKLITELPVRYKQEDEPE